MIQSISNGNVTKTSGYLSNLKNVKATQVSFTAFNPTNLEKGIIETSSSGLGSKIGRVVEEAKESLGRVLGKLTGDDSIPFTHKPLTANGEITHFGPNGEIIKIPVSDKEITPGVDGQNIYRRTGDGTVPEEMPKHTNVWEQSEAEAAQQNGEHSYANVWEQSEAEAVSANNAHEVLSHDVPDTVEHTPVFSGDEDVIAATPAEPHHKGFFEELFGGGDDVTTGDTPVDDFDFS